MVQALEIREMMQPLWDMMGKEGIPEETQEFLTFLMEEGGEWAKEEARLSDKQAQLNVEVARMEGRREATARFMTVFMKTLKKHAPATTPD